MNDLNSKYDNEYTNEYNSKIIDECIMAFKVYDSCKQKDCIMLGPVLSQEKHACIIMHQSQSDECFGKIILPGKPIDVPEEAIAVKIQPESFKLENISILDISKSQAKDEYWDVDISLTFNFKLQFYSLDMKSFNILCSFVADSQKEECTNGKDFILASVSYMKSFTLFGSELDNVTIASDILTLCQNSKENTPHVLVEAKAYPIDVKLKKLEKSSCSDDIYDHTYESPIIHVYITVLLFIIVRLFRMVNIQIDSKGFCIPDDCKIFKDCNDCIDKDEKDFSEYNDL